MSTSPDRYEVYRVICDYEALREAFADRIEDLNVNRDTVDAAGGFTPGYSAKLLCNPPMKTLGNGSLEKMLKATGMVLIAVIDDERFAPVKAQMAKRTNKYDPAKLLSRKQEKEVGEKLLAKMRKKGCVLGGKARMLALSRHQRKKLAKLGAKARWSKRRFSSSPHAASAQNESYSTAFDHPVQQLPAEF